MRRIRPAAPKTKKRLEQPCRNNRWWGYTSIPASRLAAFIIPKRSPPGRQKKPRIDGFHVECESEAVALATAHARLNVFLHRLLRLPLLLSRTSTRALNPGVRWLYIEGLFSGLPEGSVWVGECHEAAREYARPTLLSQFTTPDHTPSTVKP